MGKPLTCHEPLLHFDSLSIQKSESQASLLSAYSAGSYGSVISAFSKPTAEANEIDHEHWEDIVRLRSEQTGNIDFIKAEVQAMINTCNIQKNVNMITK